MVTSEPDYRFLTIVTFGRSGSTALQAALNAHPDTIIRGENYAALRGIQQYTQAIAAAADRHHAGKDHHPWYGTARLDAGAVLADQRRHVIEYLLRPKATTRWLGFKEVRYEVGHFADPDQLTDHLLFLSALLPGMRYLFNIRDPHSAAGSGWWRDHPQAIEALEASVTNLRIAHRTLIEVLGGDRCALVDYENWAAQPDSLIEALRVIGFEVDPTIVRTQLARQLTHGKRTIAEESSALDNQEVGR